MLGKIIGILGSLATVLGAFLFPWTVKTFKRMDVGVDSVSFQGGLQFTQGYIALAAGVLALIILFVKPKLALYPAIIALGASIWFYLTEVMGTPRKPAYGLWLAIGGAVLIIVASFMIKPKKS